MRFASVVFDFDSTLVDCETLDLVSEVSLAGRADARAVLDEVKRITTAGMEGALPFDESLSRRIALVAPSKEAVATVAASITSHVTSSVLAHRSFFEAQSGQIAIVSGGFDDIIAPVADMLYIPRSLIFANAFRFDATGRAIGVDTSRPSAQAGGKARAVAVAGLARPIAIVGDGWTDYEIRAQGAADAFIAFTEHVRRDTVVAAADAVAGSFDDLMRALEEGPLTS